MPTSDDNDRDDALLRRLYDEPDADSADGELAREVESYRRVRGAIADYARATEVEPPSRGLDELLAAARQRAPARAAVAPETPGVWARLRAWFQPIAAHPALASAAMVVVVAVVGGVLYVKGSARFADKEARPAAPIAQPTTAPVDDHSMVAQLDEERTVEAEVKPKMTGSGSAGVTDSPADLTRAPTPGGPRDLKSKPPKTPDPGTNVKEPSGGKDKGVTLDSGGGTGTGGGGDSVAVGDGRVVTEGNGNGNDKYQLETIPATPDSSEEPTRPEPQPPTTSKPPPPPKVSGTTTGGEQVPTTTGEDAGGGRSSAPDVAQLTRQARTAARAGDCAVVRAIGGRVKKANATYHTKTFVTDADIKKCL